MIVILAVIALISTPTIIGVIDKARKGAFEDSAYGVLDAGKVYFVDKLADDYAFEGISISFPSGADLKLSGEKPAGGNMYIDEDGNISFALYDQDKKWCALKFSGNEKVEIRDYEKNTCQNLGQVDDYVKEGLLVQYDVKSNVGKNMYDPNATTFKNLVSNTYDGVLHNGAAFIDGALYLDGVDDWVGIGELNYQAITIEIVTEVVGMTSNNEVENVLIDNYEYGGYGISLWKNSQTLRYQTYKVPSNVYDGISLSFPLHQKFYVAGRTDQDSISIQLNGRNNRKEDKSGQSVGYPVNQTHMVIGANAAAKTVAGGHYNGKVYAVRIYNRALTDQELEQNRQTDTNRFQISDT